MSLHSYFIGLDLGQARDFTAIAVLDRVEEKGDWDAARATSDEVEPLHIP